MNCCAIAEESSRAMKRAVRSVPPPAAKPTRILTGLVGYCAKLGAERPSATAIASAERSMKEVFSNNVASRLHCSKDRFNVIRLGLVSRLPVLYDFMQGWLHP